MAEAADGTWVLVYSSATGHLDNTNQVLQIRFSDDEGATWTAENTYLDTSAVTGFPMCPTGGCTGDLLGPSEPWLIKAPNDNLLLNMWNIDFWNTCNGSWQSVSADNGATWGAAAQIDFSGITGDSTIFLTDDGFVYDGVIYAVARQFQTCAIDPVKNLLVKSTDNGASWVYVSDITSYTDNTVEGSLEYLGNNTMISVLRGLDQEHTYQRYSYDMGLTWGTLENITSDVQVSGRHRTYTLAHMKGEANWWNDPTLIMEGFVNTTFSEFHPRRNAVWISGNQGEDWEGPLYVDDACYDGGYGDMLYDLTNDEFVMTSYCGPSQDEASIMQYRFQILGAGIQ